MNNTALRAGLLSAREELKKDGYGIGFNMVVVQKDKEIVMTVVLISSNGSQKD